MIKPINVLILIDTLTGGGAQEYIYQLCQHVSPKNIVFQVYAFKNGLYAEKLRRLGIPVTVVHSFTKYKLPLIAINLFGFLKRNRFDIVHTFLQGSFMLGTPISSLKKIKTIHSIVATRRQVQKWYFPAMKLYQRWIQVFLTFCPDELKKEKIDEKKIKAVEITLDLSSMNCIKPDPGRRIPPYDLDDNSPVALSIGRLHPDKGHEYAIKAWPMVLKVWPKGKLLILGEGEDENRLKNLTHQLKMENFIIFAGFRPDLESFFIRAGVFLRTSVNEGVNLTSIQAMAAGIPVIGFRNRAPKEIIHHGTNGLLCDMTPESLAETIIELFGNHDALTRMTESARKRVNEYYDIRNIAAFHERLYDCVHKDISLETLPDMSLSMADFEKHFSGL